MNAFSPFSLLDKQTLTHAIGSVVQTAAHAAGDAARDVNASGGLPAAFAQAYSDLDANADGKLDGTDALGHVLKAGNKLLEGFGEAMGFDMADEATEEGRGVSEQAPYGASAAPLAQMLLAADGVSTQLSAAAARVRAGLPGVSELQATYAEMRTVR